MSHELVYGSDGVRIFGEGKGQSIHWVPVKPEAGYQVSSRKVNTKGFYCTKVSEGILSAVSEMKE